MPKELLERFPNKALLFLKKLFPTDGAFVELIDSVRLNKYIEETDFEKLNVEGRPICSINEAEWDYPLINVCFIENMLRNVVYCLSNGYQPRIMFHNSITPDNMWELLFKQPWAQRQIEDEKSITCDVKVRPFAFRHFLQKQIY